MLRCARNAGVEADALLSSRHPEVAASSAALEGRRPGCIGAVHPPRLCSRCFASQAYQPRALRFQRHLPAGADSAPLA
jgi:hypothetical protein